VRAVLPPGMPGMPGMPGIRASSNSVTALVSRLRILGEVLTSRSADAGRHPEHSPPADSGTPQRRVTTPRMVTDKQHTPNAEYSRLTLGLPRHGTCEQMPRFCVAAWPN